MMELIKIIDYILNSEKDIIRTPLEISMLAEYVYLDGVEIPHPNKIYTTLRFPFIYFSIERIN